MSGAIAQLLRVRLWVLIGLTVISAVLDGLESLQPVDLGTLGEAADRLFSSRWADTFSEPRVQVGPIYLAFIGLVQAGARAFEIMDRLLLSIIAQVAVVVLVSVCVRAAVRRRGTMGALIEFGAGVSALAAGLAWTAYISGHAEEAVMAALWMGCAYAAYRGRHGFAGLALAAATGLKLWGLLGIPLLLLLDSTRARLKALGIALGLTVALYGPFFLWGEVATFEYRWPIKSPLLLSLLGSDQSFDWALRVAQGALTVIAGGGLALWLRGTVASAWAVPLGTIAVRIAVDPLPHYYFWMPFEFLTIVGAAWAVANLTVWKRVAAATGTYVVLLGRYLPMAAGYVARFSMGVFLIALVRSGAEDESSSKDLRSSTNRSHASASE
jgi:hypothetical protein